MSVRHPSGKLDWLATALFALLFLWGSGAAAQSATYAYRNDVFSYDTPSGAATSVTWHTSGAAPACTTYFNGDDDWADVSFPAGFAFTFAGVSHTGVRVYSNGILAFGNDVSGFHRDYTPQALPAPAGSTYAGCPTAAPVNVMLPYWIDIVAGTANGTTGASVQYEMLGTAPNRRFVISWVNVKLYNTTTRYNFQVALYESAAGINGNFRYQYTTGSSTGTNSTVGVQLSATDYTQYSYNQAFIDTTNGTSILWYPANQLATKSAEYRFDEGTWSGVAGEVKDTSGNAQHASRVGSASSTASGKLCRGGSFTNNTSNATIDAVATPIVPGNQGSITFWYRSTNSWTTADTMLIDATTVANRPFFVMKRSTGALRFALADSAGTTVTANSPALSFAANTWVHIGVAWNVRVGTNQTTLRIFVNGVLQNGAPTRGTTTGILPVLGTFHIGDNRTSGVTPTNGTPNGANGTIDEVYAYSTEISAPQAEADMNLTRPTCTNLDHFRIAHGGTGTTCATASVTITAHDPSHALFSLAGTTMSVSTSTNQGTWSAITAINPVVNTGPGTATYTFANESSVVLGLNHAQAGSVNINVNSGGITESSGTAASCVAQDYSFGTTCDANLVFSPCLSNFECVESSLAYNNLVTSPTLRNPLYTKLAGTPLTFDVVAVDPNGNRVTSYAADADKPVTVELVDGTGATACASRAVLSPSVSTTLTFPKTGQPLDQGRKSVSFTVNRAHANLRCRVTDANQSPSVVGCSSDNFAIRPGAVTIPVGGMATPPSATATPTLPAGIPFLVTATTATAATDNYAGTLALDTGKLTAQTTSQDTTIQSGGTVGTLTLASLVANQTPVTGNATYTEVGYLYLAPGALRDDGFTAVDIGTGDCIAFDPLNPTNTDWLSTALVGGKYGCSIGNQTTVSFGRFRPYHFDTEVTNACLAGSFTYSGRAFPLKVTAKHAPIGATTGTTTNYAGSFAKALTYADANGATGTFSPTTLAATSFAGGVADLTATPSVSFAFASKASVPATLKLRVTESGGASSSLGTEGTIAIRSGVLRMDNAYGSELLGIRVPVRALYCNAASAGNCTDWRTNLGDTCTSFTSASAALGNYSDTLAAGNFAIAGQWNAAQSRTSPIGTGSGVSPGTGVIAFNRPTCAAAPCPQGSVDLTLTAPVWLQGGSGTPWPQNPVSRLRFGSPKAPYIYLRERY